MASCIIHIVLIEFCIQIFFSCAHNDPTGSLLYFLYKVKCPPAGCLINCLLHKADVFYQDTCVNLILNAIIGLVFDLNCKRGYV